jgi:hypothetical protein
MITQFGGTNELFAKHPISFMFLKLLSAFLLILIASAPGSAEPPNGSLSITYQQLSDGKLSESYHELTLSCYDGECSLQSVTFNQCWDNPLASADKSQKYSFIKVESSSTSDGGITLANISDTSLTVNQNLDGANLTYRFEFTTTDNPLGTKLLKLRRDRWFANLADFSGAATKSSEMTKKVYSWQMVPVRGESGRHFASVKTTCAVRVSALPSLAVTPTLILAPSAADTTTP